MTPAEFHAARARLGWTQEQMAEALGITQAAVSMMESDVRAITRRTAMQVRALEREADASRSR